MVRKFAFLVITLLLLPVMTLSSALAEVRAVELGEPVPLVNFHLQDQKGNAFGPDRFMGHWSLTLIGYTRCPDVCPFVLSNIVEMLSQMSVRVRPDNLPQVFFVAVDPDRDREVLEEYVGYFGPSIVGATGSHAEITKFVENIDGFYRLGKPNAEGDYEVRHSASVVVTGPDGKIHLKLSPPLEPGEVAEYLARKQIEFRRLKGQ